jgi:hypothetical protein
MIKYITIKNISTIFLHELNDKKLEFPEQRELDKKSSIIIIFQIFQVHIYRY